MKPIITTVIAILIAGLCSGQIVQAEFFRMENVSSTKDHKAKFTNTSGYNIKIHTGSPWLGANESFVDLSPGQSKTITFENESLEAFVYLPPYQDQLYEDESSGRVPLFTLEMKLQSKLFLKPILFRDWKRSFFFY